MNNSDLTYVLNKPRGVITLDLFEAELYEAAIVVQPLVGNLVFYSNHGRYEPRIAERWERVQPNVWTFYLREGFTCENGELITAESFRQSLERSILSVAKKGAPPILPRLTGYKEFLKTGKNLAGLSVDGNALSFHFDKPQKGGLVEVLSFAPYGYICKDNLNSDGSWKDKTKFISSGPYGVAEINPGKKYVLKLREEWIKDAKPAAPRTVTIVHEIPADAAAKNIIVDSLFPISNMPKGLTQYKLVPEYLNAILLGNLEKGFFANLSNRIAFKKIIEKYRNELPETFGVHYKANTFYADSKAIYSRPTGENTVLTKHNEPLIIEGKEPLPESFKYESWQVLKKSLDEVGLKYEFAGNDTRWQNISSLAYDLRLRATSIGGAADIWNLDILFCSSIGPNYPDPGGNICKLIEKYDDEKLSDNDFESEFAEIVERESTIVPISHLGIQMFLGPTIKSSSLSPALNVIRFDQVELE